MNSKNDPTNFSQRLDTMIKAELLGAMVRGEAKPVAAAVIISLTSNLANTIVTATLGQDEPCRDLTEVVVSNLYERVAIVRKVAEDLLDERGGLA